jgi:GNAT superfamily N-acetyltransferase
VNSNSDISIRFAEKKDAQVILDLIKELALFEKAPGEVTNTLEEIERDGFGENPAFKCLIAELNGEVAGLSLYYIRYSTWKGRILYLEDLIVSEKFRGKGIGKVLLERTLQEAEKLGVNGTRWQVLDWNEPAIEFYKKYNCTFDGEWINCNMDKAQLKKAILAE